MESWTASDLDVVDSAEAVVALAQVRVIEEAMRSGSRWMPRFFVAFALATLVFVSSFGLFPAGSAPQW